MGDDSNCSGAGAAQLNSAEPNDRAEPNSAEVPQPEINHLHFPPRGKNRPTLRQVLRPDFPEKDEFLGAKTEWPTHLSRATQQRRRPDPRDDPSVIQDTGLRKLLQQLDEQKRGNQLSPARSSPMRQRAPEVKMHHSPAHQAIQVMQSHGVAFRERLNELSAILDEKSAVRRKEQRLRHERAKAKERMKEDVAALQTFAKRCAERDDWTYCDPPGYFEKPLKIERDASRTGMKIDGLQGIYDVKDDNFKPPHSDFGGWVPHSTNEREAELDLFALPPKHYAKPHGKDPELEALDRKVIMLERERLLWLGDTSVNSETIAANEAELKRIKAEQKQKAAEWYERTVPPGSDKVIYRAAGPPGPGLPRPSRLAPSEAYFACRLDRTLVEAERVEAKELVLKTMGTHRKKRMETDCDSFSALAKGRTDQKPAWGENNNELYEMARINFYATTSPRTCNNQGKKFNTTKAKLPVLDYFSEYEPAKPGDNPYVTGLAHYIEQPERATSVERNFIVGDETNTSCWKAPPAGAVSGSMVLHARAQAMMCPPACKKLLTSELALTEFSAVRKWKSDPNFQESTSGARPKAAYLKKGAGGGTPCRTSASLTKSVSVRFAR